MFTLLIFRLSLLFRGIKRYTIETLSLDSMSEQYHILAVNYIFLMIYATLESVFVNTLLYRITPDISIVILYRGITFFTSAVTMHLAAYIGHRKSPVFVVRTGGVIYLLMYAVLFFGMDHMNILMYLTAVLSGAGGAFYWSGHNILIPSYTTPWNRDIGISILGIIQGAATLFVPVFSGSIISVADALFGSADTGYRIMFGLGMVTVAAQVRYQRKLPPAERLARKSEIRLALRMLKVNITHRYAMCYEFFRGFRDGTFGFILSMILFELVTSESLVGLNSFLTGIMSITGAWVYGKFVTPPMRTRYILIATSAMMLFCAGLLWVANAPLVMLFAMINAFFAFFVVNASANSAIDVMTQSKVSHRCLGESIAIREVFLGLGRILGLVVLMIFPSDMRGRIYAMLLLTGSQYIIALFVDCCHKRLERRRLRLAVSRS